MMKHKKVVLPAIIAGMYMAILPVPAVFASEATEPVEEALPTTIGITACYSDSVTPDEGDIFSVTFTGSAGTEVKVDFNAAEYADVTQNIEVEPDNYTVKSIVYKGENDAVVTEGYAMNNNFSIMEGEYADVTLAIGNEECKLLNSIYESTISYKNSEVVNGKEAFITETDEDASGKGATPEPDRTQAEESKSEPSGETHGTSGDDKPSALEKEAKVIYEEPDEGSESTSSLILRAVPLLCLAGIAALIVFILHKKGKI